MHTASSFFHFPLRCCILAYGKWGQTYRTSQISGAIAEPKKFPSFPFPISSLPLPTPTILPFPPPPLHPFSIYLSISPSLPNSFSQSPPFPVPSLPIFIFFQSAFLSLSHSPPLPLNSATGAGERCELPQWGLGRSPSRNRILCTSAVKSGNFSNIRRKLYRIWRY